MTEDNSRRIDGLVPRGQRAPLGRLIRSNRLSPAGQLPAPGASEPNIEVDPPEQPLTAVGGPATAPEPPSTKKVSLSTYIHPAERERARAVYRATAHLEGDQSFSDMVEKAISREAQRREDAHNGGARFGVALQSPLRPGRPLG